jgi:hypothetical protein
MVQGFHLMPSAFCRVASGLVGYVTYDTGRYHDSRETRVEV